MAFIFVWELFAIRVFFCLERMNASLHPPIAPGRKFSASVCLLAALLLWAPLWAGFASQWHDLLRWRAVCSA